MIVIHGGRVSPFVRKTHVFCLEKGIPFDTTELSPVPKTPELLRMSPLGKIPVLEDAGTFVPDSSVICAYLERVHPRPPLYPESPKDFARALFLEEWADTRAPEAFAPALVERVILPRYMQQEPDEERLERVRAEDAPPVLDWLEEQLAGVEGEGLVGGRFSVADCAVGAQLQSWAVAGETIDAERWPRLRAYSDALLARPSFKALTEAIAAG